MFTGLVTDLGTVAAVDATPDGVRVAIASALTGELREGDSVAVNGVCLTATDLHDGAFAADVMHETLRRS
ncbi:MAG: riboflavin synthase, partial [Solirubrobacteraceae bacterium]